MVTHDMVGTLYTQLSEKPLPQEGWFSVVTMNCNHIGFAMDGEVKFSFDIDKDAAAYRLHMALLYGMANDTFNALETRERAAAELEQLQAVVAECRRDYQSLQSYEG